MLIGDPFLWLASIALTCDCDSKFLSVAVGSVPVVVTVSPRYLGSKGGEQEKDGVHYNNVVIGAC